MALPELSQTERNDDRPPAGSSHRWTVLGACFAINFLSSALFRNAALFYPSIMNTFLVSREQAALPLFVFGGCFHLGALLGGAVIHVLTVSTAAVAGGILFSATFVASAFATGTVSLAVVLGVLGGTAEGIIFNCSVVGLGDHFASWRGLALGVVMTGAPTASFIFPPLFHYALGEYGLRGTLLLTGACMINIPMFSILLRQRKPPNRGKTCGQKDSSGASQPNSQLFSKTGGDNTKQSTSLPVAPESQRNGAHEKECYARIPVSSKRTGSLGGLEAKLPDNCHLSDSMPKGVSVVPMIPNTKSFTDNVASCTWPTRTKKFYHVAPAELQELLKLSIPVLLLESKKMKGVFGELTYEQKSTSGAPRRLSRWAQLARSARTVTSTPRFYVTAYAYWAYCFFLDTYLTVIVDYCTDIGVEDTDAVHVLSFFSVTDALCRLLIPCLTDWKLLSTSVLLPLSYLLASVLAVGVPFLTERVGFWTVALTLGLPCGYINVGLAENLSAVTGEENLPMALGFMSAAAAVGSFTTPSLIGAFRDTWGSYNDLFFVMASALVVAFGLFAGLLILDFCKRKTFVVSRQ